MRKRLTTPQEKALAALLAGETATDAARAAGVHRSTIHRWLNDAHFLAEFNGRRTDLQSALDEKLAQLQAKALSVVEDTIDRGDARTAVAVLRGSGLLDGQRRLIGPTDPDRIAKDQAHEASQREILDSLAEQPI